MAARRKTYHHGDLRRVILDATVAHVAKHDVGDLSLRRIAAKAKVSHQAPYRHFADRAALFAAVSEEGYLALGTAMAEAVSRHQSPVARLEACGIAYVEYAAAHPGHFRLMSRVELAGGAKGPELEAAIFRARSVLIGVVAECHEAGIARHVDAAELLLTSWSTAHGLAMLWVDGILAHTVAPADRAAEVSRLARIVARGLGALLDPKR